MQRKKTAGFSFSEMDKKEILKDIWNPDVPKACQDTNILSKLIKENVGYFSAFYALVLIRPLLLRIPHHY